MTDDEWQEYFETQARGCGRDGSPLYDALVSRLGEDHSSGGVVAELLEQWQGNPILQGLAMRFLGAVHHLVLAGEVPDLARHYPSTGGKPNYPEVEDLFVETLDAHRAFVAKRLQEQVQTNEVRRSAALLGGFLSVADETGLPLRILEIGASAGLNQLWDRYRYELGPHRWGECEGEPLLATDWSGPAPALGARVRVESRRACDLFPIDLSEPEERRRLEAFIWPDQPERRERFLRAADAAVAAGVRVERASALPWLEARLEERVAGAATVLFHSVMWLYLDREERRGIRTLMDRVGGSSKSDRPLAWLRMEAKDFETCELRLRLWPTGDDRLLGTCGFHGQSVEWVG
jgi:hypothetical protein